jgi:CelD/BcsL family acetyltransferase involved in cellulose biosynthesis
MEVAAAEDFAPVAAECAALLAAGAAESFFLAPWWWRTMCAAGVAAGARPRFLTAREAGAPVALLPLLTGPGRAAGGLAGPYTCLFAPLFAPGAGADTWRAAGRAFARHWRGGPPLRLDALDAGAAWLGPFLAGARAAGLHGARFDHFGNWHEPLGGRDWDAYLRDRPGALRETVRRKLRRGGAAFRLVAGGAGLEAAIAQYEDVYARSWKVAEPFPRFQAEMMAAAAAAGVLRLGLLSAGGRTVAAQIWIVAGGTATVLKLAHDEAFKPLSPGTVLAAHMIRHLIAEDRVEALDFGRGDDAYKRLWTTRRRQRIGVILADPWRPAGLAILLRQALGRLRRRVAGGTAKEGAP